MAQEKPTGGSDAGPRRADVIVVGAGFAGMYATHKFRRMGKAVVAVEAGGDVGGVWYWNRYPGARCDLMSVDYSYGFSDEIQQEWTWSEQFAAQPEILAYANFVADKLDLRRSYLFGTRITGARWRDEAEVWRVTTDTGLILEAPFCVMATGPLSVAKDPDIPGIDRFEGRLLRAQKWPHEPVGFAGLKVGLIGTGSTGIQIVQEVGREAGELHVFQRTPSFTLPMRNHVLEPDYVAEMKRHYPAMRESMRNNPTGGTRPATSRPYFSLPPSQRREAMEQAWINGGHTFLGSFADLLTNQEANDQVADFVRDKIGAIVEITAKGVRTRSREIELDVLILATGYDALTGALLAFDVVGRNGRTLKDKWRAGARSYLGLAMNGFPNFFAPSGPNGPAALANLITVAEHDVDWIADMLVFMDENGLRTVEPTAEAEDGWMSLVAALAEKSLIRKANTWWVGANVKGKPQGLTMFIGGFHKYRELCADAAKHRRSNFTFDRGREQAAA